MQLWRTKSEHIREMLEGASESYTVTMYFMTKEHSFEDIERVFYEKFDRERCQLQSAEIVQPFYYEEEANESR